MPAATVPRPLAPRALAAGVALLAACADTPPEPPPADRNDPERRWTFYRLSRDGASVAVDSGAQTGGEVHAFHEYGFTRMAVDGNRLAFGEVFSSADGKTYHVSTEDPSGALGTRVELVQAQSFRKRTAGAALRLQVTEVALDGYNQNFDVDCDPMRGFCPASMITGIGFAVAAYDARGHFFSRGSSAFLEWHGNNWTLSVPSQIAPFWTANDFVQSFTIPVAKVRLAGRVTVPVDLSRVAVGEEFTLRVSAEATTYNRQGRESFLFAHFRDPLDVSAPTMEFEGLEPTNRPLPEPPAGTLGMASECAVPVPDAGSIQFARAAFSQGEAGAGGVGGVVVTRTGGTRGAVSASVRPSGGSAVPGTDFEAVATTVAFADGDAGPRTVAVPVMPNDRIDGDRTVALVLAEPRGCATVGAPASAVLTIHDDDAPPPPSGFPVGGLVSGLAGSGLVLQNAVNGETLAVSANGAFTFLRRTPSRVDYDVRVATQPSGPAQVCTVANGRGTMGEAAVTNVALTCVTPAPTSGLDPGFGTAGRVTTPLNGGRAEAVVVQPDGKIVVAGSSSVSPGTGAPSTADFTVLRYLPNGTPDATFGTGGVATVGFPAGRTDEALDVALQADGRIVVVGTTGTAGGELDFGVARFNADGTVDRSFGTNGLVTADFGPGSASAQSVAVQPDGRIVVAGHAQVGPPNNDFALARYNADGTPDPSFGTGGRVTTPLTGRADLGMAVALAPDGTIVVAGRAQQSGARGDDLAVARYTANGALDPSFGGGGFVTTDVAGGSEQANDVVVLADGRIVVAGYSGRSTGSFDYALARYTSDGRPDASFGTAGVTTTDLSGQDDFGEGLVVQGDGRLVVVGRRTSGTLFDLALVRYLGDGTRDASFGTAGRIEVDIFGDEDRGQGVAVQADGRIVAAGVTHNGRAPHVALVRVVP